MRKDFDLAHSYADNGTYTVTVMVSDDDGGVGSDTVEVKVANVTPSPAITSDMSAITEGSSFTLEGSLTDPGDDSWKAQVIWGDGGPAEAVNLDGKQFVPLSHTYKDNGTYAIEVTVTETDSEAASGSNSKSLTVNNVAPAITFFDAPVAPVPLGTPIASNVRFTDPGVADTATVVWAWDDGSPNTSTSVAAQIGERSTNSSHTYVETGLYTISVTVTDKDGGSETRP